MKDLLISVFFSLVFTTIIAITTFYILNTVKYEYLNNFSGIILHNNTIKISNDTEPSGLKLNLVVTNNNPDRIVTFIGVGCEATSNTGQLVFKKTFSTAGNIGPLETKNVTLYYARGKYLGIFTNYKHKCVIKNLQFEKIQNEFIDE